jgi:hypothetical protein
MSVKERNAYVSKNRTDGDLAQAVTEMPAVFSGVLESDRNAMVDAALRAQHGNAMEELVELERAIQIAESAVETGRDELRLETGLSQRDFDEAAEPFERKAMGPRNWLKREVRDGKETVLLIHETPGVGLTSREATVEEQERGEFFANVNEWKRANSA